MDWQQLIANFPWRDVAATAIIAFLFWKVFIKLTEIITGRLDSLLLTLNDVRNSLKRVAENDLPHIAASLDRIAEGFGERISSERKGERQC